LKTKPAKRDREPRAASNPLSASANGKPSPAGGRGSRVGALLGLLATAALTAPLAYYAGHRVASGEQLATASVSELRLRSQNHPHDPRFAVELARRYMLEQRLPEAARLLDGALQAAPQSTDALYLRALVDYFQHDPAAAQARLQQVLKLDPHHAQAQLHLGMIDVERSEFNQAVELLRQYVAEESQDPAGYYWLGVAAFASGYEKLAFWSMEQAIKLAPDVGTYHLALGGFYFTSKRSGELMNEAIRELREAVRLSPGDWMIHYRMGVALTRAQRLPEAAAELEEAVRLNPKAYEPHFLLPQIWARLGNRQKAQYYQRIAEGMAKARPGLPGKP
jgi:cytochrome c-type biogenesis protein CcmH/NrfG